MNVDELAKQVVAVLMQQELKKNIQRRDEALKKSMKNVMNKITLLQETVRAK